MGASPSWRPGFSGLRFAPVASTRRYRPSISLALTIVNIPPDLRQRHPIASSGTAQARPPPLPPFRAPSAALQAGSTHPGDLIARDAQCIELGRLQPPPSMPQARQNPAHIHESPGRSHQLGEAATYQASERRQASPLGCIIPKLLPRPPSLAGGGTTGRRPWVPASLAISRHQYLHPSPALQIVTKQPIMSGDSKHTFLRISQAQKLAGVSPMHSIGQVSRGKSASLPAGLPSCLQSFFTACWPAFRPESQPSCFLAILPYCWYACWWSPV